jgi:hypothetical protein
MIGPCAQFGWTARQVLRPYTSYTLSQRCFAEIAVCRARGSPVGANMNRSKTEFGPHTIWLSQEAYIDNLIEQIGVNYTRPVTTPLAPGAIRTKDQSPKTPEEIEDMAKNRYRKLTSSL